MMRLQNIRQTSIRYRQISLWLTAATTLVVLMACRVSALAEQLLPRLVNPLVVSALFSLVASTVYGVAWASVAKKSPANLAKFYLAASGLKMMLAAAVFLVCAVLTDKQNLVGFTAIFALFYIVLLVFDCIFFARVEKKTRLS